MTTQEMGGQRRTATIDGKLRQNGWLLANHGAKRGVPEH